MNKLIHIGIMLGLILLINPLTYATTSIILVEEIFKPENKIETIKIIGYTGDSIMTYVNTNNQDTLELECKWKEFSESFYKTVKENHPKYDTWEGSFPKIGETILMLSYKYGGHRILFARKEKSHYRFWDPMSIPFANSVFFIPKEGIYKPTDLCKRDEHSDITFECSDGFLIEEKELVKMKIFKDNHKSDEPKQQLIIPIIIGLIICFGLVLFFRKKD